MSNLVLHTEHHIMKSQISQNWPVHKKQFLQVSVLSSEILNPILYRICTCLHLRSSEALNSYWSCLCMGRAICGGTLTNLSLSSSPTESLLSSSSFSNRSWTSGELLLAHCSISMSFSFSRHSTPWTQTALMTHCPEPQANDSSVMWWCRTQEYDHLSLGDVHHADDSEHLVWVALVITVLRYLRLLKHKQLFKTFIALII